MSKENKTLVVFRGVHGDVTAVLCDRPTPSIRNSDWTPTMDFVNRVLMKSADLQGYGREDLLKGTVLYRERMDYIQDIPDNV